MKLEEMAKFGKLAVKILIDSIESLLKLLLRELADGVVGRVVIHVREEDRLGE